MGHSLLFFYFFFVHFFNQSLFLQQVVADMNAADEGHIIKPSPIKYAVNNTDITVQINETATFASNFEDFIKNYVWHNPLRNSAKLIEYISKNTFNSHEQNADLVLVWNIQAINEQIVVKIPMDEFELDLDKCDEKEQLQYYKQQYIKMQQLIKMNNLIIDQIVISEFSDNCIFKIYSLAEAEKYYLAELPKHYETFDQYKPHVLQSIVSNFVKLNYFAYYSVIDATFQKLLTTRSIFNKKGRYLTQIKPLELRINIYDSYARINPGLLALNNKFAVVMEHQKLADFFTKDIILADGLKFTKNTYTSQPLQVNFYFSTAHWNLQQKKGLQRNRQTRTKYQASKFTVFYRVIYTKQMLYLKYLLGGYGTPSGAEFYQNTNFAISTEHINAGQTEKLKHLSTAAKLYSVSFYQYYDYEQKNGHYQQCQQSYEYHCFLDISDLEMTL